MSSNDLPKPPASKQNHAGPTSRSHCGFSDAVDYLARLREQLASRPDVYKTFLDTMKSYKANKLDAPQVIARIAALFQGNQDLIFGFNTFLPSEYRIEVSASGPPVMVHHTEGMSIEERTILHHNEPRDCKLPSEDSHLSLAEKESGGLQQACLQTTPERTPANSKEKMPASELTNVETAPTTTTTSQHPSSSTTTLTLTKTPRNEPSGDTIRLPSTAGATDQCQNQETIRRENASSAGVQHATSSTIMQPTTSPQEEASPGSNYAPPPVGKGKDPASKINDDALKTCENVGDCLKVDSSSSLPLVETKNEQGILVDRTEKSAGPEDCRRNARSIGERKDILHSCEPNDSLLYSSLEETSTHVVVPGGASHNPSARDEADLEIPSVTHPVKSVEVGAFKSGEEGHSSLKDENLISKMRPSVDKEMVDDESPAVCEETKCPPTGGAEDKSCADNGPKLEDSRGYINRIKTEFASAPQIYEEFLSILEGLREEEATPIWDIVERVYILLRGKKDLLLEFNAFLPKYCKIVYPISDDFCADSGPIFVSHVGRGETLAYNLESAYSKGLTERSGEIKIPLADMGSYGSAAGSHNAGPLSIGEDRVQIIDIIRKKFIGRPLVFECFLDLLQRFRERRIDTPGLLSRMLSVLDNDHALVARFASTILPAELTIEDQTRADVQATRPLVVLYCDKTQRADSYVLEESVKSRSYRMKMPSETDQLAATRTVVQARVERPKESKLDIEGETKGTDKDEVVIIDLSEEVGDSDEQDIEARAEREGNLFSSPAALSGETLQDLPALKDIILERTSMEPKGVLFANAPAKLAESAQGAAEDETKSCSKGSFIIPRTYLERLSHEERSQHKLKLLNLLSGCKKSRLAALYEDLKSESRVNLKSRSHSRQCRGSKNEGVVFPWLLTEISCSRSRPSLSPQNASRLLTSSRKKRQSFASRSLEEVEQATRDWHAAHRPLPPNGRMRSFSLRFNECSIAAVSLWADRKRGLGDRSRTSKSLVWNLPTVDPKDRLCSVCAKWGHYEVECDFLTNTYVSQFAGTLRRLGKTMRGSVETSSKLLLQSRDKMKVELEACVGVLIEQRAERFPVVARRPLKRGRARPVVTADIMDIDGLAVEAGPSVSALKSPDRRLFADGELVAWHAEEKDGGKQDLWCGIIRGWNENGGVYLVEQRWRIPASVDSTITLVDPAWSKVPADAVFLVQSESVAGSKRKRLDNHPSRKKSK